MRQVEAFRAGALIGITLAATDPQISFRILGGHWQKLLTPAVNLARSVSSSAFSLSSIVSGTDRIDLKSDTRSCQRDSCLLCAGVDTDTTN